MHREAAQVSQRVDQEQPEREGVRRRARRAQPLHRRADQILDVHKHCINLTIQD